MQGVRRDDRRPWVVGVSGASGTRYARAVLNGLLDAGSAVDVVVSRAARLTLLDEVGLSFRDSHWREDLGEWLGREIDGAAVAHWAPGDLAAGPSSGSYPVRGMVVVPASTAAVAGIAIGLSKDLLQRAADVTLKEGRPLVVVPRETPYTRATLRHLLTLHEAGAVVLPASPGFYGGADSVQQLVDFVAAKVLDVIGVEHDLITRWTGELGAARSLTLWIPPGWDASRSLRLPPELAVLRSGPAAAWATGTARTGSVTAPSTATVRERSHVRVICLPLRGIRSHCGHWHFPDRPGLTYEHLLIEDLEQPIVAGLVISRDSPFAVGRKRIYLAVCAHGFGGACFAVAAMRCWCCSWPMGLSGRCPWPAPPFHRRQSLLFPARIMS